MARKKTFEFNITCPIIDGEINKIENVIYNCVDGILSEHDNENNTRENRDRHASDIWQSIESEIEAVRKTNSDMRKEAEYQIESLADELEDGQRDRDYYEAELASAKAEIDDLKHEISMLQD